MQKIPQGAGGGGGSGAQPVQKQLTTIHGQKKCDHLKPMQKYLRKGQKTNIVFMFSSAAVTHKLNDKQGDGTTCQTCKQTCSRNKLEVEQKT